MKTRLLSAWVAGALLLVSCGKDKEPIDSEYPTIDITAPDAFPVQCSTVKRGERFTFRANFSDNVALGSYSLDIHHNFDHHAHSTEVQECDMEAPKTPSKPLVYIKTFDIPDNPATYQASAEIDIPTDIDPGDYHFMIRITDKEGWQTMRGLSIKIQ